jgi:L-fuculose-phosphate aldolase
MNEPSDDAGLRDAVLDAARGMERAGLNRTTAGNASVRRTNAAGRADGFLITPTGMTCDLLTRADIVVVDWSGRAQGTRKPSSEWQFHRAIYQQHAQAGAVLHAHSPFATALACIGADIPAFHYMIARFGGDSIRCAPYATFGSAALSENALTALEGRNACLLANHGMLVYGREARHALGLAIEFEALCEHYWRALQVGRPQILSAAEMAAVVEKFKAYGQQPDPGEH